MADTKPQHLTRDGKPLPKGAIVSTDGGMYHSNGEWQLTQQGLNGPAPEHRDVKGNPLPPGARVSADGSTWIGDDGRMHFTQRSQSASAPAPDPASDPSGQEQRVMNDPGAFDAPISPEHNLSLDAGALISLLGESTTLMKQAEDVFSGQTKRFELAKQQLEGESDASYQSLRDAYAGADNETIRALKKAHQQTLSGKVKGAHARIVGEVEQNSLALMERIEKGAVVAEQFLAANPSPVHALYAIGLGSEARSRYTAQIANAGASSLKALIATAIQAKNTVLGAAILDRINALSPEDQKLAGSKDALADALIGDVYRNQAVAAKTVIQNRNRVRSNRANFMNHGSTALTPTQKINDFTTRQRINAGNANHLGARVRQIAREG